MGVDDLNNKLGSYLKYLVGGIQRGNSYNPPGIRKLANFIEEKCKKTNNGKTYYRTTINTPLYYELISYLYGNYSDEIRVYEKIQKKYKKNHNNLRHTTIVAHGFEGINKEKINKMLEQNGVNEDINNYFKSIKSEFFKIANSKEKENIFDKLNKEIINHL